jgi:hypothetical protein
MRPIIPFAILLATTGIARADHADCTELWKDVTAEAASIPVPQPWARHYIFMRICHQKNEALGAIKTVFFDVPGSGNDHTEYGGVVLQNKYSLEEMVAKEGGVLMVTIDRLSTGLSTHPHLPTPAGVSMVDVEAAIYASLITQLKAGTLEDTGVIYRDGAAAVDYPPMQRAVYFGRSLAVVLGWRIAHLYPGLVNLYNMEGVSHDTPLQWIQDVGVHFGYPAKNDPTILEKLAPENFDPGLFVGGVLPSAAAIAATLDYDPTAFNPLSGEASGMGYITSDPPNPSAGSDTGSQYGWYAGFFTWAPGTNHLILETDELRKGDTSSYTVDEEAVMGALAGVQQPCASPAEPKSESCYLHEPVVFMLGQHDGAVCGVPSFGTIWLGGGPGPGIDCSGSGAQSAANFIAAEAPFYASGMLRVENVIPVPDAGHHGPDADSFRGTAFPAMMARMRALLGTCGGGPCL